MASSTRKSRLFLTALFLSVFQAVSATEASGCMIGNYNLTRLSTFNPWTVVDGTGQLKFEVNLCASATDNTFCSNGITISGHNKTSGQTLTYGGCGNHSTTEEEKNSEMLVIMKGATCSVAPNELATTMLFFKCGKSMGSLTFLDHYECTVILEWESIEFCTDLAMPAAEIPCSVVVNETKLIDLSPLAKQRGGYLVDSQNNRKFYINVCRDITPDTSSGTGTCPKGSGSCRVIDNSGVDMGRPTNKLQVTAGGDIQMVYTSPEKPNGCIDKPVTTVSFKCPERGGSREPVLIGDFLCNVEIEWFTEYACPQQTLTSTTCKLTMETHNIDIDLTPLRKPGGEIYQVSGTSGSDTYQYGIAVCSDVGFACGADDTHTTVCQTKPGDDDFHKRLGLQGHQMLRYSDRELSLIYKDGDACHTKFRRETVINFHCKQDAENGGIGKPVFVEDNNCTYFFDWDTKYACVGQPPCRVEHEGKRFDLSSLAVESGHNWVVVSDGEGADHQYFINVCHDVLQEGDAQSCPSGSSVCEINDGKAYNLGSFTSGPVYDPSSHRIYINYTSGAMPETSCTSVTSTVIFICKPGELESGPSLVFTSSDHCFAQFEWHTAAACPLSHQQGTGCKVVDTQAGYSFDLSVLTKAEGYKVSAGDYDYYINVCDKLTGDHCKDAPHNNAAVCQVKPSGSASDDRKTGEPNGNLQYFDGVLNLTYTNGEADDEQHSLRKTEIAFICDPAAGAGSPEFVHKQAHTYNFKWLTAYACPTQPVECVATDSSGKQYDLSSLSKSAEGENWVVLDDSDLSNRPKFYINVCRPLNPVQGVTGGTCDTLAAACETTISGTGETVSHKNLGQVGAGPTVETGSREVHLSLIYKDGDLCPAGGNGARFNTTVHFICVRGQESRGPSPARETGPCSFEVLWDTEAACEVTDQEHRVEATEKCTITDPNTNFTFNLGLLRKTGDGTDFYTAQSADKSRTFRLNICGPVSPTSCGKLRDRNSSVCEVKSGSTVPLTYGDHEELEFTAENKIMLTYLGHEETIGHQTRVKIELACDREAGDNTQPTFIRQEGSDYFFRLATPLSCSSEPVDCTVQDNAGHQYDLSSLGKITGNWEVQDSRPSHRNLRYHINICRPMNEISGSTCPGGPIGGCQLGGQKAYGLGYIQSKPQVAADGTITLRYVGGTICHRGTPNEAHRSMRINFHCAATESAPVFLGESPSCEYSFEWQTPSACPQQRSVGSECKVVDPLYNYQFDLIPLRKTSGNYEVPGDGYTFLLNVCGALHSPPAPAECQDMGACQTGASLGSPVQAGKPNSTLIYDGGELSLVYQEGKDSCHGKYTRQTILTFRCDHGARQSSPQYLHEMEDCTYTFDWPTSLACPPHTIVDCTFSDQDGNYYDLSSLARADSNYVEMKDGIKYVLNICRSLVHRKGETCSFNSAACMINMTESDSQQKYQSLGQVSDNPLSMEEGKLVIRYNSGAPCSSGGTMSTMIVLSCSNNPDAHQEGGPQPHFVRNNCEYVFMWDTPAACPLNAQGQLGQNCTVKNPATGYEFNLKSLDKTGGWEVNDREGHLFKLNVCGPVTGSGCSGTTGSCQSEINGEGRSFNSGNANAKLEYLRDGVLFLNYSGGDVCHHNNVSRTTIVSFICQQDAGQGRPVYVADSDGCVYHFDWHTSLVCENMVKSCQVAGDGWTIDLTPLIKRSGHHLAIPDEAMPAKGSDVSTAGRYYINVCHPLNPVLGTLCPAGAAACRVQEGKPPQGLGQARSAPVYNADRKEVILQYDNGWPCQWNPSQNTSSRIIFRCKRGPAQGTPRLIEVSESCEYIFEWETNIVCSDTVEVDNSSCKYFDTRTGATFDLSVLNDVHEVKNPHGGKFSLRACGPVAGTPADVCQGAAICLQGSTGIPDGSYGQSAAKAYEMENERLKLTFSGGRSCQNGRGTASTVIEFECEYSAGKGQPILQPFVACEVSFKWKTSLVCPPLVQECALPAGDMTYDLTILSQGKRSWEYKAADGTQYWLNLCQAVHSSPSDKPCSPQAAVCRRNNDGSVDMLGDVRSQRMYTEKAADGSTTVVVEYSQGSPACSSNRRRSNNQVARSIIRLTCAETVGSPVLVKKKENCVFEFEWKTRTVCQKDSLPKKLKDINHVIQDPRSGGSIDLRPLLTGGVHKAHDGHFYYAISLEGHPQGLSRTGCAGATVCKLHHENNTFHQVLGTYVSREYYLQEDKLEVVYNSPEKCTGKFHTKNISSVITFSCKQDSTERTDPTFLYNTLDCVYLFSWETPAACIQAKIEVQTEASAAGGAADSASVKNGIKTSTLTAIISTFSGIIVLCILAIYFHKPERRANAAIKLKRLILCRRSAESQMKYSVLSQMEEDPEISLPGSNPFGSNPFEEDELDEEKELQNGDTVMVKGYHDDSDDDLLL